MKTEELTGVALDWAAAKAIGQPLVIEPPIYGTGVRLFKEFKRSPHWAYPWHPSTNPAQIVPLIHTYRISVTPEWQGEWHANVWDDDGNVVGRATGADLMIAACRALVHYKLGDEVTLDENL